MKILAIETSCDETSAAIVESGKVLEVKTVSQISIHKKYGGVVPEVASRNHTLVILPTIEKVMKQVFKTSDFRKNIDKLDALAVTTGPGLVGSLLVGINTVKTLAYLSGKKIYPVNHLEGHIYANWIKNSVISDSLLVTSKNKQTLENQSPATSNQSPIQFPAIVLIVSGGHTSLIKMTGSGKYTQLGQTLDDAAGEAFDKVAKLLDLSYPGGPEIEKRAIKGNPNTYNLPVPMQKSGDLNFSFSGLKTAVLYLVRKTKNLKVNDVCRNFQDVLIQSLLEKTAKAVYIHKPKSILLSGGVINNQALRNKFSEYFAKNKRAKLHLPERSMCTDNAAMIGIAAYYKSLKSSGKNWYDIDVDPNAKLGD
ncbi:tRNA (adenosine(37)-N6)-threonylcarbamoyltransferase complex transferase subunit TsaD [Patescibacteria group bacterium]